MYYKPLTRAKQLLKAIHNNTDELEDIIEEMQEIYGEDL